METPSEVVLAGIEESGRLNAKSFKHKSSLIQAYSSSVVHSKFLAANTVPFRFIIAPAHLRSRDNGTSCKANLPLCYPVAVETRNTDPDDRGEDHRNIATAWATLFPLRNPISWAQLKKLNKKLYGVTSARCLSGHVGQSWR
jgi:hypothetical protein